MLRASVSVLALVACGSLAVAADLEGPSYLGSLKDDVAAPVAQNWSGLYIGLHAGYGWGEHDGTGYYTDAGGCKDGCEKFNGSFDLEGALGGGQVGINLQSGSFVFGIEADGSWVKIDGSGSFSFDDGGASAVDDYRWDLQTDVEWLASLRGRIGFLVTPTFLIYGTGGVAWAGIETHQQVTCFKGSCGNPENDVQTTDLRSSETAVGWVAGLGAEWQFAQGWSLKAEWQHYDFGDVDTKFHGVANPNGLQGGVTNENYTNDTFPGDLTLDVIRIGVNYKFGN